VKASISEEITPMFTISPLISSYVAEFSALVRPFKLLKLLLIVPSLMPECSFGLSTMVAPIPSNWVPTTSKGTLQRCQENPRPNVLENVLPTGYYPVGSTHDRHSLAFASPLLAERTLR